MFPYVCIRNENDGFPPIHCHPPPCMGPLTLVCVCVCVCVCVRVCVFLCVCMLCRAPLCACERASCMPCEVCITPLYVCVRCLCGLQGYMKALEPVMLAQRMHQQSQQTLQQQQQQQKGHCPLPAEGGELRPAPLLGMCVPFSVCGCLYVCVCVYVCASLKTSDT